MKIINKYQVLRDYLLRESLKDYAYHIGQDEETESAGVQDQTSD